MALDQPLVVLEIGPGEQREAQLLDGREGRHPQQLFLERADHALGAAVTYVRSYELRARFDAEERELVLERNAQVLTAVIVTHREATGDIRFGYPEAATDALAQRLQCLVARRPKIGWDL